MTDAGPGCAWQIFIVGGAGPSWMFLLLAGRIEDTDVPASGIDRQQQSVGSLGIGQSHPGVVAVDHQAHTLLSIRAIQAHHRQPVARKADDEAQATFRAV